MNAIRPPLMYYLLILRIQPLECHCKQEPTRQQRMCSELLDVFQSHTQYQPGWWHGSSTEVDPVCGSQCTYNRRRQNSPCHLCTANHRCCALPSLLPHHQSTPENNNLNLLLRTFNFNIYIIIPKMGCRPLERFHPPRSVQCVRRPCLTTIYWRHPIITNLTPRYYALIGLPALEYHELRNRQNGHDVPTSMPFLGRQFPSVHKQRPPLHSGNIGRSVSEGLPIPTFQSKPTSERSVAEFCVLKGFDGLRWCVMGQQRHP